MTFYKVFEIIVQFICLISIFLFIIIIIMSRAPTGA